MFGPLLFSIYMLPLEEISYLSKKPSVHLLPLSFVNCLQKIKTCMTSNLLKLNPNKTELMVVAPIALLQKVRDLHLNMNGSSF